MKLLILIHDPGHRLSIRAHVRSRDVFVRAEDVMDLIHEAPSQSFQFIDRQIFGIHGDATFGTAIGNVHNRGLPCHQRRQGQDFVSVNFMMVPQSAFHGATFAVVLDTKADKGRDLAIVAFDRDLHLDFSLRDQQQLAHAGSQIHHSSRFLEVLLGCFKCALHKDDTCVR